MHLEWEPEELLALQKGGNKSFIDFMKAYGLNDLGINAKYNSVAGEYYRKMLKGYIEGKPINELPPVKKEGGRLVNGQPTLDDSERSHNALGSPIKRDNSSLDLSGSSFSYRDKSYENKWNNTIQVNKSFNVSRYSINIEAQNDLNKITILLNDNQKLKGIASQKQILDRDNFETDIDTLDVNDEDLISDKDKYSEYYGSTSKHLNFNELPDIRATNELIIDNKRNYD